MLLSRCALFLVIWFLPLTRSTAQPAPAATSFWLPAGDSAFSTISIGASFGFGRLHQDATFKVYRPSSDTCNCGIFGPATSTGLAAELSLETPLRSHPSLDLIARLGIDDRSAVLLSGDTAAESRGPDGSFVTTVMHHEFHASLLGMRLSAGAALGLIPGVRLVAAPTMTFLLVRSQEQLQRIVSPAENLFLETGESTRPVDGHTPVDFRPVMFGADLSLLGKIPLGARLALRPELRASLTFGSIAGDLPWHQDAVTGLVGVSYLLTPPSVPSAAPVIVAAAPSSPPSPRPFLGATIVARGVDDKGKLYDDPVIEIQRAPWTEGVPVVPYIFFDSASAGIPERYALFHAPEERERFAMDSLLAVNPLDIHWQLLNVVGRRMQANPKVTLAITGTVSGDEAGEDGTRLGMGRAEAVANYLTRVWMIAPARIATSYVPRSSSASPEESLEGREENRRAELRFSDDIILSPVVIHRLATIASPPAVRFMREIVADTTVAEWYVTVVQGGKELLRFDGSGGQGTLEQQRQWSLADMRVNHDMTPIRYRLYVRDVIGQEVVAEGAFKVAERTTIRPRDSANSDREVVQYSIVGFPYNSADLLPRHLQQLGELAREITEQSDVQIVGYTDKIGDPERNRQLSLGRAKAVQDALRAARARLGLPPIPSIAVLGLGSEREVFNNVLPEGRLLSRMVQVTVIKHFPH